MLKNLMMLTAWFVGALGSAQASLVTNPGFEAGNLSGWTVSPGSSTVYACGPVGLACNGISGFGISGAPHSGVHALAFGPLASTSISQTIGTVAGQAYDLSFWLSNCPDISGCTSNALTFSWDGIDLLTLSNANPFGWSQYTFTGVASSSSSTVLSFRGLNGPSFFMIDDVSVERAQGSVPEPSSLALGGLALALAAAARRRPR